MMDQCLRCQIRLGRLRATIGNLMRNMTLVEHYLRISKITTSPLTPPSPSSNILIS